MPKFKVLLTAAAEAVITVEAADEEEAREAAFDHGPAICAQCSGWGKRGVTLDIGEWDVPTNDDGSDVEGGVWLAEDGAEVAG